MWTAKVIDLTVNRITVSTVPVIVKGLYINTTLSAHVCNINNGSETILKVPASYTAGTVIDFAGDEGLLFSTNLIIDPDDSASGSLTIFYKTKVT